MSKISIALAAFTQLVETVETHVQDGLAHLRAHVLFSDSERRDAEWWDW